MKKITFLCLALSFSILSFSQITIKGKIVNDSIPLESASVIIKNSTKGVATNSKGQFKLEAKKGDTLSISYLGYETKELVVNKNESLNIQLEEGNTLDEVVILGYSTTTRCHSKGCCCWIVTEKEERKMKSVSNDIQLKLYPNPSSSGVFQLKLIEDYDEVKILVTTISGQIIQNSSYQNAGEKLNIDLSTAAIGLYIINIIADGRRLNTVKAIRR